MTEARYPIAARLLHWIMALLIIGMLALGLAMVDSLASWRTSAITVHKLCGLSILLLAVGRLMLKLFYRAPSFPAGMPPLQRRIAHLSHHALYGLMIAVPLVGLAMQGTAGTPVILPGAHVLPVPIPTDLALYGMVRTAHGLLAWALLTLILLHIAAALHHAFVKKDGLLRRML